MANNNYTSLTANQYSTYSDFYKVSFITTSSVNIPKLLKQTGGLIIMNNTDDIPCVANPAHGAHHPKSLWFRGDMIASGYGALCEDERKNLTYLSGTYNSLFVGIDDRFNDVSYYLNSYNAYMLDSYSYTINTVDRVKKEAYFYTDNQIERVIGGAPDYLDTLAEISYWLKLDQSLGMDTMDRVNLIQNTYITHEPIDVNGYTYVSTYSWELVPQEGTGTKLVEGWNPTGGPNGEGITYWTEETFTYTYYIEEQRGMNAFRDVQVATHWKDAPLDKVLDLLVHPYPYTEPTVSYVSYMPAYAEVGDTINWAIYYDVEVNDSDRITEIALTKKTSATTVNTGSAVSFTYQQSARHIIEGRHVVSLGTNVISEKYSYSFAAARLQYYPQIAELEIVDEDHAFKNGKREVEQTVQVQGYYKIYSNHGDTTVGVDIPATAAMLKLNPGYFVYDDGTDTVQNISLGNFWFTDRDDMVWFAIPDIYPDFTAYIRNIHTDIMQPMSGEHNLDGNILKMYYNSEIQFIDGVNYKVYRIQNNRFLMANQYELIISIRINRQEN